MGVDAEAIREGAVAAEKVADPRTFPAVIALVSIAGACVLVFWMRQDAKEERAAFLAALHENTAAISKLADEVHGKHSKAPKDD